MEKRKNFKKSEKNVIFLPKKSPYAAEFVFQKSGKKDQKNEKIVSQQYSDLLGRQKFKKSSFESVICIFFFASVGSTLFFKNGKREKLK